MRSIFRNSATRFNLGELAPVVAASATISHTALFHNSFIVMAAQREFHFTKKTTPVTKNGKPLLVG